MTEARKRQGAIVLAWLSAFVMVFGMAWGLGDIAAARDGERTLIRGGVVRLGPGWYLHENGRHEPVGIERLELVNGCQLHVVLAAEEHDRIITAIADEDAELSGLRVQAGIHGGARSAVVQLWRDGEQVCVDDPMFEGERADVWLMFAVRRG